jgi:hypothetical protein
VTLPRQSGSAFAAFAPQPLFAVAILANLKFGFSQAVVKF